MSIEKLGSKITILPAQTSDAAQEITTPAVVDVKLNPPLDQVVQNILSGKASAHIALSDKCRAEARKTLLNPGGDNSALKSFGDPEKIQLLLVLKGHTGHAYSAAFSPDGKYVVSGSLDGTARLWSAETGKEESIVMGVDQLLKQALRI